MQADLVVEPDRQLGDHVAVQIDLDHRLALVDMIAHLARPLEPMSADELELLLARPPGVAVEAAQVDAVPLPLREVEDQVGCFGTAVSGPGEGEAVGTRPAVQEVTAVAAGQPVVAGPALEPVTVASAEEPVVAGKAAQTLVRRGADQALPAAEPRSVAKVWSSSKAPMSGLVPAGVGRGWPRWSVVRSATATPPASAGLAAESSSAMVSVGPPLSARVPVAKTVFEFTFSRSPAMFPLDIGVENIVAVAAGDRNVDVDFVLGDDAVGHLHRRSG